MLRRLTIVSIAAGAALLAACGGNDTAADNLADNGLDANLMDQGLGNDASAMESVGNGLIDETPPPPVNDALPADDMLGDTDGGDTGGNTVESNVAGM